MELLLTAAATIVGISTPAAEAQSQPAKPATGKQPNILVIWGDDIGWQNVSAYGMSRPALYLQFKDKEAIFSRVIENMDAQALTKIRTAIAKIGPLNEKLLHACTSWGMHGVELAAAFPDAADLFDLRFPAVRQVYRNFQALVVEILQANIKNWPMPVSPEDYALTLTYGMRGCGMPLWMCRICGGLSGSMSPSIASH